MSMRTRMVWMVASQWVLFPVLTLGFHAKGHFWVGFILFFIIAAVYWWYAVHMKCANCGYNVWRRGALWAQYAQRRCWRCKKLFSEQP
jgi:hypothetical protein